MSRVVNKKIYCSSGGFMYNCNIAMQRQTTNTMYPQLHTRACLLTRHSCGTNCRAQLETVYFITMP
jgi:hypothetical protein